MPKCKIKKNWIMLVAITICIASCGGGTSAPATNSENGNDVLTKSSMTVDLGTQVRTPSSVNVTNSDNQQVAQVLNANSSVNTCFVLQKQANGSDYSLNYKSDTWYSSASMTFSIKNSCNTVQSMSGVTATIEGFKLNQQNVASILNIGQDGGTWVNISSTIQSDIINVNFTDSACDGDYCDWVKMPAGSVKNITLNTALSAPIDSIGVVSVNVNSDLPPPPPPQKTGNLNVTINSTSLKPLCRKETCKLKINVLDPSTQVTLAPIEINPIESALYSMEYQNILPGTYTISVDQDSLPGSGTVQVIYAPTTGMVDVQGDATSTMGIKFNYTAPQPVANLTIALATVSDMTNFANLGDINATAIDTTESASYNFKLKLGESTTIKNLPIGHQYKIHVQGIANAASGSYYAPQDVVSPYISKSGSNVVNLQFTSVDSNNLHSVVFSVTDAPQQASITFADNSGTYKYVVNTLVDNKSYKFLNDDAVAMTLNQLFGYTVTVTPSVISVQVDNVAIVYTKQDSSSKVAGWPDYLAMGAIGGPNISPESNIYTGGDDSFGGKPIDAVFKYAGDNGNGDPGMIDPPMNALRMTSDLTLVSNANQKPSRVVIVEYTGEMSGGENFADFTNTSVPNADKQGATYIMARHFASLSADAMALADKPVVYNGQKYYGSLIMNPDLLGAMQQNNYVTAVNNVLSAGAVNTAVDQALCLMTNERTYTNNDEQSKSWSGKSSYGQTYTGTPYSILSQMLADNFPAWLVNAQNDQYWGISINNAGYDAKNPVYSQVGQWFNQCVANPQYDKVKYNRPNFQAGFEGWVQANNWLIRTFAAKDTVTFGWQTNMWAIGSGYWMHQDLTNDQIASTYSTPVINWLKSNAPSTISNVGTSYAPDFFVFDRYEMDDSAAPGQATLYNARSWDNFLIAIGQVSKGFNNIPLMLWQIPGSHIPYVGESTPELFGNTAGSYIFSSAPVYFFGDSNLAPDLSNMIMGSGGTSNTDVGNFKLNILLPTDIKDGYHCPAGLCNNYQQYLMYYNGKANNYDWSKDNGKLALAAQNNVFAILWGGGNTTNVIKNFSNPDDHGWLANKVKAYYTNPILLN